jgi:hypothetical protein
MKLSQVKQSNAPENSRTGRVWYNSAAPSYIRPVNRCFRSELSVGPSRGRLVRANEFIKHARADEFIAIQFIDLKATTLPPVS